MKMKSKIGWLVLLCFFFFGEKMNAQLGETELSDNRYLRYGFGISNFGEYSDFVSVDFEFGYSKRFSPYISSSVILNYGMAFEYGEPAALQSHLSMVFFMSPFRNDEKFLFKIGPGFSTIAAYDVYDWDGNGSGVFVGGCLITELGYFSKKRNKYRYLNIFLGGYTSNQSLIGVSFFREISIAQIKKSREQVKSFY